MSPPRRRDNDAAIRAARQTLRTGQLLGVSFVNLPANTTEPHRPQTPAATPNNNTAPLSHAIVEPKPPKPATPPKPQPPNTGTGPKAAALDDLRERYAQDTTTAAHLIEGWNTIVFHDGDPDAARLMFVGEAPGADEDRQGRPFVGKAGQKLDEMIRAMGLSRDTVYIANILKVRPPGNRNPTDAETTADGPYLREQIDIVKPRVIVTLGNPATHYLLDTRAPMARLRATLHDYNGIPVSPTYHPAFLLRQYTRENRQKVWADLQLAMSVLNADG